MLSELILKVKSSNPINIGEWGDEERRQNLNRIISGVFLLGTLEIEAKDGGRIGKSDRDEVR